MQQWYFSTKKFKRVPFYWDDSNPIQNPLETVADFDRGENWSMDCKITTGDHYPDDPEDDCFVLVPKTDIIKTWRENLCCVSVDNTG